MALEPQERRAVEMTLRRFAGRIEALLFASEAPNGDLTRIPQLLAEARGMDIVADPAPDAPGHTLGVWGRCCWDKGLALAP